MLMVTANDLKEFAMSLMEEARKIAQEEREKEAYLTETEVCKLLNVTHTTLWRWNKNGTLPSCKMGRRTIWRKSDIDKFMIKEG